MTAAASPDPPYPRPEPRLLRRHHDFRRLWSATTVSQLGTQVSELAIPLVAILLLKSTPIWPEAWCWPASRLLIYLAGWASGSCMS